MKRPIIIALVATLMLAEALMLIIVSNPTRASQVWWDTNWKYRRPISIGSHPENLQIRIVIPSDIPKSDYPSIRFFEDENSGMLPYWIERDENAYVNVAWVRRLENTSEYYSYYGGGDIWMYYGNPSATSAENGDDVFMFFDDFGGGSGGQSSLNSGKWGASGTGVDVYENVLRLEDYNNDEGRIEHGPGQGISTSELNTQRVVEFRIKNTQTWRGGVNLDGYGWGNKEMWGIYWDGSNNKLFQDGRWGSVNLQSDKWWIGNLVFWGDSRNLLKANIYYGEDNANYRQLVDNSLTDFRGDWAPANGGWYFDKYKPRVWDGSGNSSYYYDWFFVRKWDATTPTVEVGNEECLSTDNTPPSSFVLLSPENNSSFYYNKPTLTWGASFDNESGLDHYEVWLDNLNVDNVDGRASSLLNVALGKPVTASSTYGPSFGPGNTVDNNLNTRWSSEYSDPQWIRVDLGQPMGITGVVLQWETAYGKSYEIQVSNDAVDWTTVYSTTSGVGGVDNISGLRASGRYVRMYGAQRDTGWGYSLWEFEVYGNSFYTTHELYQGTYDWYVVAVDAVGNRMNSDNTFTFTLQDNTPPSTFDLLSPENNASFYDYTPTLTWEASSDNESGLDHYEVWLDNLNVDNVDGRASSLLNVALGKPVTASSTYGPSFGPGNTVDNNINTRWSSEYSDPQWIRVDLGQPMGITGVVLQWETAYGRSYEIQVSNNAIDWTTIYSTTSGDDGVDNISGLEASGRYVRMYGTQRGTGWGYSLWEFEVYSNSFFTTAELSQGAHYWSIVAVDGAGNRTYPDNSFNFTLQDNTPPSTFGLLSPENNSSFYDNMPILTWKASSDNASGLDHYEVWIDNSNVDNVDGRHGSLVNLALGRPVTASSTDGPSFEPGNVVDNNLNTRWSSEYSDPQWIYIDLGRSIGITGVALQWETAYGRSYEIQVSNNAIDWTTIYSTTSGDDGVDNIIGLRASGRYVRMYGTHRGTGWGYSLWEFEVYSNSFYTTPELAEGTHYWHVVAVDAVGNKIDSDNTFYFTIARSGWCNINWTRRRQITIAPLNIENYQIKVIIPGDIPKSDYPSIRFLENERSGLLPYWIERNEGSYANVAWVRRFENDDSTIWMYYHNPSATSVESGRNVFMFFDDFGGGSGGQSALNSGKWGASGTGVDVYENVLRLEDYNNDEGRIEHGPGQGISTSELNTQRVVEFRIKNTQTWRGGVNLDGYGWGNKEMWGIYWDGSNNKLFQDGRWGSVNLQSDKWWIGNLVFWGDSRNLLKANIYYGEDNANYRQLVDNSLTDFRGDWAPANGGWYFDKYKPRVWDGSGNSSYYYDWFFVRKYADNSEPNAEIWNEETLKPVLPNPASWWSSGTIWGTNLRLENSYVGEAWFGIGADSEVKQSAPPLPSDYIMPVFVGSDGDYMGWVKSDVAAPQHFSWYTKLDSGGEASINGTVSSVADNVDAFFVPQDFSVVLENSAQDIFVNLRRENGYITGLPKYATLFIDNAVNISVSPSRQFSDNAENVSFTLTISNTGRYDDNYSLSATDMRNWALLFSPQYLSIPAGGSGTVMLTVTPSTGNDDISVQVEGAYATDNAICTIITNYENNEFTPSNNVLGWGMALSLYSTVFVNPSAINGEFTLDNEGVTDAVPPPEITTPGPYIEWYSPYGDWIYPTPITMGQTIALELSSRDNTISKVWCIVRAPNGVGTLVPMPRSGYDYLGNYSGTSSVGWYTFTFYAEDWSNNTSSVTAYGFTNQQGKTIAIQPGWNLVSFPGAGSSDTPNNLFAGANYTMYYWTAPGGPYNIPSYTSPVLDNIGYWVYLNTSKTVVTSGGTNSRDIQLKNGWNLVGFPSYYSGIRLSDIFVGLTYNTDYLLYSWTAPGGPYNFANPDSFITNGVGFWVKINRDYTVTIPPPIINSPSHLSTDYYYNESFDAIWYQRDFNEWDPTGLKTWLRDDGWMIARTQRNTDIYLDGRTWTGFYQFASEISSIAYPTGDATSTGSISIKQWQPPFNSYLNKFYVRVGIWGNGTLSNQGMGILSGPRNSWYIGISIFKNGQRFYEEKELETIGGGFWGNNSMSINNYYEVTTNMVTYNYNDKFDITIDSNLWAGVSSYEERATSVLNYSIPYLVEIVGI